MIATNASQAEAARAQAALAIGPPKRRQGSALPAPPDRDRNSDILKIAEKKGLVVATQAPTPADRVTWILAEGRVGDDAQLVRLASALGWPYQILNVRRSLARVIVGRLLDAIGLAGPIPAPIPADGCWPDLVLGAGGRSVSLARRIKAASGGRARVVFVGRPWAALDIFDLVITTPQYRLPVRPNVVHNLLPLNYPDQRQLGEAASRWRDRLSSLPRPWLAVLAGGDSGSFRMTTANGRRLAERANAITAERGGSVLVTTSSRTPPPAAEALIASLRPPAYAYRWCPNDPGNPYLAFLALADAFLVTGESASMIAEALNTSRSVELFELDQRLLSRIMTSSWTGRRYKSDAAHRRVGVAAALSEWLVERGWWIPSRDLRHLHRTLLAQGLLGNEGRLPPPPFEADMRQAVDRIRGLSLPDRLSPSASQPVGD
jgi:uncharacterized protein